MLRRKGSFSARIFVPRELQQLIGRAELWRSTRTSDYKEARLRESIWLHHFSTLFLQLTKAGRAMPQDQLAALVHEYLDTRLEEVEERLALDLPGTTEHDRDAWQNSIVEKLERIEIQLIEGDCSDTIEDARRMLDGGGEVAIAILARRLLEAKYDALRAELRAMAGKPLRRVRLQPIPANAAPSAAPKITPRISEVCHEYMQTTGKAQCWTPSTEASRRQAVHLLVDFLDDRPIGEVTKTHMTDAYMLLPRMPAHYSKRYPKLTPKATIEAADKRKDTDRYSPKSCNLRLEVWRAVFKYAVATEVIDKAPIDHLKAFAEGRAQDAREAFTDDQLSAFFALLKQEMQERPEHYWIARVMAYSGLRLEEAAALRPCDVREVEGVWCLEVSPEASNIKTENSARLVPIHSALLGDLRGYVEQRKGKPKGNLWGLEIAAKGKWSSALSKRMNKRLKKALPKKSERLVIESFRNTFATRLKAADVQEHAISELMGHAVDSLAVGRYGKKLEPSKLLANIERLSLPPCL